MFRRFGSQVTIIQRGKQLLAGEDPDVAEAVAQILREDGVKVLRETGAVVRAEQSDGAVRLTVRASADVVERALPGSHLLVAAGRVCRW